MHYYLFIFVFAISSCDSGKRGSSPNAEQPVSREAPSASDSVTTRKIGSVVSVEKYYEMRRSEFLSMADAGSQEVFMEAYTKMRIRDPDEQSFRVGCIYFYQFDNMMSGLENGFKPPFQDWMRTMGKDLGRIIDRILELPDRPECNQVAILFAAKFGKTFEEGLTRESARRILTETREKLKAFD